MSQLKKIIDETKSDPLHPLNISDTVARFVFESATLELAKPNDNKQQSSLSPSSRLAIRKIRTLIKYNCKQHDTKACVVYKEVLGIINRVLDEKMNITGDVEKAITKALKILKYKVPDFNTRNIGKQIYDLLTGVLSETKGE